MDQRTPIGRGRRLVAGKLESGYLVSVTRIDAQHVAYEWAMDADREAVDPDEDESCYWVSPRGETYRLSGYTVGEPSPARRAQIERLKAAAEARR